MTDVREQIADIIEGFCGNGSMRSKTSCGRMPSLKAADSIIAALPSMVTPLVWEHVSGKMYDAIFSDCLYRKVGNVDGSWSLRVNNTRYETYSADTEEEINKYANDHVAATIMAAFGLAEKEGE